jgi:hypothetical protein
MPAHGFWRSLREDFESLQGHEFSLIWYSSPPLSYAGEPLDSHWSWFQFPDDSLRARFSAIALKGARALGYDSEDGWYERLRASWFVGFKLSRSTQRRSDGVMVDSDSGQIIDVVKESITLCYELDNVAESESTAAVVGIFRAAMEDPTLSPPIPSRLVTAMTLQGLNAPQLAAKARAVLKRRGEKKLKVDRATIYRLVNGKTKNPNPLLLNAVFEVLKLSAE